MLLYGGAFAGRRPWRGMMAALNWKLVQLIASSSISNPKIWGGYGSNEFASNECWPVKSPNEIFISISVFIILKNIGHVKLIECYNCERIRECTHLFKLHL